MALDTLSNLILQIYRAARETPVDEYQDFVLGLVRALVPFTSSRWITGELTGNGAIQQHCVHLQNEPTDIVLDWEAINRMDKIIPAVTSNPSKAIGIHTESFYHDREFAEIRDYTRRYRHANVMAIAALAEKPGYLHAVSLFRADPDEHFVANDKQLLEQLAPHMFEALTQNRLLSMSQAGARDAATEEGTGAIASSTGQLHYAGSGFNRLLREEWPDWKGIKLPKVLLDALSLCGSAGFSGVTMCVTATHVGQLIFLKATPRCILTRLSPRELSVATLYGQGSSYKEIARQLDISPATTRNFIQHIYAKLDINDKAELATIVSRIGHASGTRSPSSPSLSRH